MIWYFKNKQAYEYPSNQLVENKLITSCVTNSIYNFQKRNKVTELIQGLILFKQQKLTDLTIIIPIEELSVNCGSEDDIDIQYCNEHQIPYKIAKRQGGAMVLPPNDIVLINVYYSDNNIRQHKLLNDFVDYLNQKNIVETSATTNNNDVIFDGVKVASAASQNFPAPLNNLTILHAHFSITPFSIEYIDKICKKPMLKQPGFLSDYNIQTEEVLTWLCNWFQNNSSE